MEDTHGISGIFTEGGMGFGHSGTQGEKATLARVESIRKTEEYCWIWGGVNSPIWLEPNIYWR